MQSRITSRSSVGCSILMTEFGSAAIQCTEGRVSPGHFIQRYGRAMDTNASRRRQLDQDEIDEVFKSIDIPNCPAMVSQVLVEAQKDIPDFRNLANLIASDVGMSALALKHANSPLFRTGASVGSVPKALDRLAIRNIVCAVVSVALRSAMQGASSSVIERFWKKTTALAMAVGMISRRQYGLAPDAAYTYALFHDVGIPLMMRRYPEYEERTRLCAEAGGRLVDMEDRYFPCTHPIIGSLMVRSWGLPPLVGQAIRFHHEPDVYELSDKNPARRRAVADCRDPDRGASGPSGRRRGGSRGQRRHVRTRAGALRHLTCRY